MAWLLAAAMIGCMQVGVSEQANEDEAKPPATVVQVQSAGPGVVFERLATTAVVEAERSASLLPVAPGVVRSIHADEGDRVQRGDLLAVLESVSLEAGAERSRAEVRRLQRQLEDSERLHAQGAISTRDLDDLRFQLATARTNAGEAARSFGQTRITAPFDGVVARRDARIGELANSTALFQVVDLDDLVVRVELPERDFGRVKPGQPVELVSAYDDEVRGTGRVARVAPVVDAATGTFRAHVELDPDQPLRPGQFVRAHIEVARHADVLAVPREALLWEDGRAYVFVMGDPEPDEDASADEPPPDGPVALRRRVEVGLVDRASAEILGGIERGAQVIVLGQSNLKEGARVRTPADNARAVPEPR